VLGLSQQFNRQVVVQCRLVTQIARNFTVSKVQAASMNERVEKILADLGSDTFTMIAREVVGDDSATLVGDVAFDEITSKCQQRPASESS
jgi:hypothetical protein